MTNRKTLVNFQKPRNNKLYSTSPFEEDFHRLKLTSFDKLQVFIYFFTFKKNFYSAPFTWDYSTYDKI